MACQQVIKEVNRSKPATPLPPVLWLLSILLTICSLLCSHAKPCSCSSSNSSQLQGLQTASYTYTWNTTFQQMNQGLLFRRNGGVGDGNGGEVTLQPGSLGYYMGNSSLLTQFNPSDSGWFVIPARWFDGPWKQQASRGGGGGDDPQIGDLNQASFTIVFTLNSSSSSTTTSAPLLFDILPRLEPSPIPTNNGHTCPPAFFRRTRCWFVPGPPPPAPPPPPVQIETLNGTTSDSGTTIRVTIDPPSSLRTSVRIAYDHVAHNLSVYLAGPDDDAAAGTGTHQAPVPPVIKHLNHTDALAPDALIFGITATMGQLLQLDAWNFTIEVPVTQDSQRANDTLTMLLASVLGSAAATAAIAAAVYAYFNSKYRRWKKDLDQLAKSMQHLPGVPMKVEFADIKKATGNFHETTRLGQGGFGAVYRCRLPSPSKKGDFVEVAVKKFTRAADRRYEDFLAEVSIINRLRHKNIVPLVGWSYYRGEPILIYEYMPNGSLDQLLFLSSGDEKQQQPSCICQWGTRYNIVKDIATGLQYVHHEYEPMVLHRDIKASNILIDLTFQGRLGDFGLACVLPDGKNSYTDHGVPGTIGFRAPEYIYSGKATRKTDVFAFGVLVLEIVTGKRAVGKDVQRFGVGHVTDWVWHLHAEGSLLAAVDAGVEFDADEALRLLLLGMACSHPNPSDRPSMAHAVRVIGKSAPPPDVPLSRPPVMWPPEEWTTTSCDDSTSSTSHLDRTSTFMVETTMTTTGGRLPGSGYRSGRSWQEAAVSSVYHSTHC